MEDQDLVDRYLAGGSLEEIGEIYGVSRETVRKRLVALGVPLRTLRQHTELRFKLGTAGREAAIVASFLELRDDAAVAQALDLPVAWVRRVVDERVEHPAVLRKKPVNRQVRHFSDEEILACLRAAAAEQSEILAKDHYDSWWQRNQTFPDGRRRPSWQTVLLRFGSWREGLTEAGLPCNPRSGPSKEFDIDAAVDAVVLAWQDLGRPPTVAEYDRWSPGRAGIPASATSRKRASWPDLLVHAWGRLYGDPKTDLPRRPAADPVQAPTDGATLGRPYRPANEAAQIATPVPRGVDVTALERALSSHGALQNAVASALRTAGVEPRSPGGTEPEYDLAFAHAGVRWVVEVKSTTSETIETQLRVGLGQVLRYAEQLSVDGRPARAALAIEQELPDDHWVTLLRRLGIGVIRAGRVDSDVRDLVGA